MNKELQFLIYNTPREDIKVNVVMRDETIWLTQRAMAELFGVRTPTEKEIRRLERAVTGYKNTMPSPAESAYLESVKTTVKKWIACVRILREAWYE